ncbi:MAG: FG-GAP-like repeat-containing protein, partial [Bacteroidota bacterium]
DYDNDGWKDMYITNGYRRDVSNLDYLTYTVDSINRSGGITQTRFPDFNDFLNLIPSERLQNYIFRNNRNLTFSKASNDWGITQESFSNGAAYVDLDNDGDLDLVVNNIADPAFLYQNNSREQDKNHFVQLSFAGADGNKQGVGTRVWLTAADGSQQYQENYPVRGFFSSVTPVMHFGLGSQTSIASLKVVWPNGQMQVMENLEADKLYELSMANAKENYRGDTEKTKPILANKSKSINFQHQENDFEDFDRERLLPHRLSKLGPYLSIGDVNGDQLEDVFVGGAAGQAGAIYLQQSNGSLRKSNQPALLAHAEQEDLGAVFTDVDGDQDLDLYVVSGGNAFPLNDDRYQDRLYLNNGSGTFKAASGLPKETASGACVEALDYDQDGDMDLFVGGRVSPGAYPQAPQSFLFQNDGTGRFKDVTKQVFPALQTLGMITDIQFGDLNGDQNAEMVISGEWMPISIYSLQNGSYVDVTEQFGMARTSG